MKPRIHNPNPHDRVNIKDNDILYTVSVFHACFLTVTFDLIFFFFFGFVLFWCSVVAVNFKLMLTYGKCLLLFINFFTGSLLRSVSN